MSSPAIFTTTSLFSLLGVAGIGLAAYVASNVFLPKNASGKDRFTFIWLVRALLLCIQRYKVSLTTGIHLNMKGIRRHDSLQL